MAQRHYGLKKSVAGAKMVRFLIFLIILPTALLSRAAFADPCDCSQDCSTRAFEVRGISLSPLIQPGRQVTLMPLDCSIKPLSRDDIVAYAHPGRTAPIIKLIKAIPGDGWQLRFSEKLGAFTIWVNQTLLRTSTGDPYAIAENQIKMLRLYADRYPTLPADTYLLLGNIPTGSLDATRFGLIHKKNILGKICLEKN